MCVYMYVYSVCICIYIYIYICVCGTSKIRVLYNMFGYLLLRCNFENGLQTTKLSMTMFQIVSEQLVKHNIMLCAIPARFNHSVFYHMFYSNML